MAANIAEAVVRGFQVLSFGLWTGGSVENLWTVSGSWSILNGAAGSLNILITCSWFDIVISKGRTRHDLAQHDLGMDYRLQFAELHLHL